MSASVLIISLYSSITTPPTSSPQRLYCSFKCLNWILQRIQVTCLSLLCFLCHLHCFIDVFVTIIIFDEVLSVFVFAFFFASFFVRRSSYVILLVIPDATHLGSISLCDVDDCGRRIAIFVSFGLCNKVGIVSAFKVLFRCCRYCGHR